MSSPSLDRAARVVLDRFHGASPHLDLIALGNHGGFSGARLWRVEGLGDPTCLRAWPPHFTSIDRLAGIHRLMLAARRSGLDVVPAVFPTTDLTTWVEYRGRLWDLTGWLPGRADFHSEPTPARLEAVCRVLARLHLAWSDPGMARGPCPALQRRLDSTRAWLTLLASGWRPAFARESADSVQDWAERAWRLLKGRVEQIADRLVPWLGREFALQPCLCDIWHDHVLFAGDVVTGLVDYGSVKTDQVAVDLARLLGSLVGDDANLRATALTAYARVRPLSGPELALIGVLDETGTLLGMTNWLRWLYWEGRSFEDRAAVAGRLTALVSRVEKWDQGAGIR